MCQLRSFRTTSAHGTRSTWAQSRWLAATRASKTGPPRDSASTTTSSRIPACSGSRATSPWCASWTISCRTRPSLRWTCRRYRRRSKTRRRGSGSTRSWTTSWSCGTRICEAEAHGFPVKLWYRIVIYEILMGQESRRPWDWEGAVTDGRWWRRRSAWWQCGLLSSRVVLKPSEFQKCIFVLLWHKNIFNWLIQSELWNVAGRRYLKIGCSNIASMFNALVVYNVSNIVNTYRHIEFCNNFKFLFVAFFYNACFDIKFLWYSK